MTFTVPIYWHKGKEFIRKEIEIEALTAEDAHDKVWSDAESDKLDKLSGGKCVFIGTVRKKAVQEELI
jgi:hypothetical protein